MNPPRIHWAELVLLPRLLAVLGVVTLLGSRLPLPRLVGLLERRLAGPRARPPDVERLVRLTQGVLRRTHRSTFCFPRSLILFHMLSGWDIPLTLYFGVARREGGIAGHAWVERGGSVLAERRNPRETYHVTFTYSTPSERSLYPEEPFRHAAPQAIRRADGGLLREAA